MQKQTVNPPPPAASRMSIRRAILLLLLVAVLPLLVVQCGIYYYWLSSSQQRQAQTSKELSRSLAASFRSYVNGLGQHISSIEAAINTKWPYSLGEMNALFDGNAKDYPALNAFVFIDPQGKIQASSDRRLIGMDISDREYFQESLRTREVVLSDLLEGRADARPIFIVSRSIYHGDQLLGVMSGSVDPDRLAEVTLKVVGFYEGDACFFDRRGILVYRYPFRELTWQTRRQSESGDLVALALSGQEAAGLTRFAGDNRDHFAVRMPISPFNWVVGVSMPRQSMLSPLLRSLLLAGGTSLLVLAVSLAAALYMSRGMVRSIRYLRDHAVAVGRGSLEISRQAHGVAELQELAKAFNDTVALLRDSREVQARYRTLVEESLVGVYFIQDDKFVYVNPRMTEIFGYSQSEIIGKAVPDLVVQEDREMVSQRLQERVSGKVQSAHYVFHGLCKDGRIISAEVAGARTTYGGRPAIIGSLQDVTQRVAMEEAMQRLANELALSNQDLEQFAFVASHDLQEPLRMVSSHLDLIRMHLQGKLDAETAESMGYAVDGAARMQAMIHDLLAFSRAGRKDKGFVRTDLQHVVSEALHNLQVCIEETGAVIEIGSLPTLQAEPGQMMQLFQNLLNNAIKYRRKEVPPRVEVGSRREDGAWLFWVKDNGIGIPQQDLHRIFMIFQRLHTHREYPGTGIGLAICKRIVEFHHGRIWAESNMGEGSTFFFTLPA